MWTPDVVIDEELARAVVAQQFPELAGLPVRVFDAGWDNLVVAVGDAWLFRFVHREVALPGARHELAALRHLADRFTVPIPHPRWLGAPTAAVPWPFWGARALPGVELGRAGLADDARGTVAQALGSFLRALHAPVLATGTTQALARDGLTLRTDPNRRADPATVVARARAALADLGEPEVAARAEAVLGEVERLAPPDPVDSVLVHGDLHVRHLLVDEGRLSGVIDWGDVALADPCVDLTAAFAAFDGDARAAFLDAYGDVPEERALRARAVAIRVHASLAHQAGVDGLEAVHREAVAAIGRATR